MIGNSEQDYSETVKKTHVVLLHETVGESISRDLGTLGIFLGLWSFGHFIGSPALEWVGVLIAGMITLSRAVAYFKKGQDSRMTPNQAREWLDRKFPQ